MNAKSRRIHGNLMDEIDRATNSPLPWKEALDILEELQEDIGLRIEAIREDHREDL